MCSSISKCGHTQKQWYPSLWLPFQFSVFSASSPAWVSEWVCAWRSFSRAKSSEIIKTYCHWLVVCLFVCSLACFFIRCRFSHLFFLMERMTKSNMNSIHQTYEIRILMEEQKKRRNEVTSWCFFLSSARENCLLVSYRSLEINNWTYFGSNTGHRYANNCHSNVDWNLLFRYLFVCVCLRACGIFVPSQLRACVAHRTHILTHWKYATITPCHCHCDEIIREIVCTHPRINSNGRNKYSMKALEETIFGSHRQAYSFGVLSSQIEK